MNLLIKVFMSKLNKNRVGFELINLLILNDLILEKGIQIRFTGEEE